jgi:hypothetical protein
VSIAVTIPVGSSCTLALPAQLADSKLAHIEDVDTQATLNNNALINAGVYSLAATYMYANADVQAKHE